MRETERMRKGERVLELHELIKWRTLLVQPDIFLRVVTTLFLF